MPETPPHVKRGFLLLRHHWRWLTAAMLAGTLLVLNLLAWRHARAMARFTRAGDRTAPPEKLGMAAKARVLLAGVSLPRPENRRTPVDFNRKFQPLRFPGANGIQLEAWQLPADGPVTHGIVLLFHGYGAAKDSLLPAAVEFNALGWDALLVDFHGSGGSEGDTTSVGWHEAADVAAAFARAGELLPGKPRVLYGVSMGAAACLRAIHAHGVRPAALLMECPFDRLLTTVQRRFHAMRLPAWPAAELLVFWGGRDGGFDGFSHNPTDYARSVTCPTLLMHGELDPRVAVADVERIYTALASGKSLLLLPGVKHESYLAAVPGVWREHVASKLRELTASP